MELVGGFVRVGEVFEDVFADDDTHIHHCADCDCDSGESDNVGVDAEEFHCDEGHQDGQGQQRADKQRASEVQNEYDDDDNSDENFLGQRRFERAECFVYEAGAVIERDDGYFGDGSVVKSLGRETGRDFLDFGFYVLYCFQGIVPVADDGDAADGLCAALVEGAAPQRGAGGYVSYVLDVYGHVIVYGHDGRADVFEVLDESEAADDVFDLVDLDVSCPDVEVRHFDGVEYVGEFDAVRSHGVGVDVYLVFLDVAADGGDLGNTFCAHQCVPNVPILNRAEFVQIPASGGIAFFVTSFQGIPEYLSECGCIGAQCRRDLVGECSPGQGVKFFEDAASGPVKVDVFLEDHVDSGETEEGVTSDCLYRRYAQERDCERIGDLVFNVLRRASGPFSEDDLLVLTEIRDGVDRDGASGKGAEAPVERRHGQAPADD